MYQQTRSWNETLSLWWRKYFFLRVDAGKWARTRNMLQFCFFDFLEIFPRKLRWMVQTSDFLSSEWTTKAGFIWPFSFSLLSQVEDQTPSKREKTWRLFQKKNEVRVVHLSNFNCICTHKPRHFRTGIHFFSAPPTWMETSSKNGSFRENYSHFCAEIKGRGGFGIIGQTNIWSAFTGVR